MYSIIILFAYFSLLSSTYQNSTESIQKRNVANTFFAVVYRATIREHTYGPLNESIGTRSSWTWRQVGARVDERFRCYGKARRRVMRREGASPPVPKCIRLFRTFSSRTVGARHERKILLAGGRASGT